MNDNVKQNRIKDASELAPKHPEGVLGISYAWLYSPWGLWAAVPKNARTAFVSTALFTAVTHLYAFVHLLLNHDSLSTFYCNSSFIDLARWAGKTAAELNTDITLPVVSGILVVLYLSCTAALTVSFLKIFAPLSIVLASAFIGTFPHIASTLAYAAEWFFAALLLCAAGTFVTERFRFGWMPGILLIALGLGVYQSYFAYAIGLLLFDCILGLLSREPVMSMVKRGVKYILVLLASAVLYYVILEAALHITGISLRTYKGLDTMGFSHIGAYLASIPAAYRDYLSFFWQTPYLSRGVLYLQHAFTLLAAGALCYVLSVRKVFRDLPRLFLVLAGLALLPLALSITSAITTGQVNILNQYAYVLHFVFCLKLIELAVQEGAVQNLRKSALTHALSGVLCIVLLWTNICVTNLAYMRMHLCYENTMAYANRIVTQVEMMNEYTPETPVVLIGGPRPELYMKVGEYFPNLSSITGTTFPSLLNVYSTRVFFSRFVGISFPGASGEQLALLNESDIIANMPSYPETGSLAYYEGMILVKMSDGAIR